MTKITAGQLAVLMTLARARADEWSVEITIHPSTFKALADRDLIGRDANGLVSLDRNEVNAALSAEYRTADDKRYRHESRCRAFVAGADCATCDRLFHAAGEAFDVGEAFENVFRPFTVEYLTAGGEWRPFMSDGRNALHFTRLAEAEEYAVMRARSNTFKITRILRDGVAIEPEREAFEAEARAQDADVAAGALIDATVERYGTANPAFDAPESGCKDCACCGQPVMVSDMSVTAYCAECGEDCPGSGSGVIFDSAWHCPTGRCDGTGCMGAEHADDGLGDLRSLLTF